MCGKLVPSARLLSGWWQTFQRLIQQNGLENVVHLRASFCLGCCVNGIATVVNDKPVNNVGILNAEQIFNEEILPLAQKRA